MRFPLSSRRRAAIVACRLSLTLACAAGASLAGGATLASAADAASTAAPLSPGNYETRGVCATPLPGRASCMASLLVARSSAGPGPPAPARPGGRAPATGPLAHRRRLRPAPPGPPQRLLPPHHCRFGTDRGDRGRLQRPGGRSRPAGLRRRVLAARLHGRKRLLHAAQRARRKRQPAVPENGRRTRTGARREHGPGRRSRRSERLGDGDLARHRDRPRRLPVLPHPAAGGHRTRRRVPGSRRARPPRASERPRSRTPGAARRPARPPKARPRDRSTTPAP